MSNIMCDFYDVTVVAEPPIVEAVSDVGARRNNVNHIGKCGRKRKKDGALLLCPACLLMIFRLMSLLLLLLLRYFYCCYCCYCWCYNL